MRKYDVSLDISQLFMAGVEDELGNHTDQVWRIGGKLAPFVIRDGQLATQIWVTRRGNKYNSPSGPRIAAGFNTPSASSAFPGSGRMMIRIRRR